ncbi:MAG TPA: DUF2071 domain-containing protein [Bryobacteraceae bacterium]|nr:DUF2071 domain-containing protein [Bryobacteraceae bacterium]
MPYPAVEPVRCPEMIQSWNDLTFLHFRYRPEAVERLLPQPLEVDRFDGMAWVGIAPFRLRRLHSPWLPALPLAFEFSGDQLPHLCAASKRHWNRALDPGEFDHFLTARFRLFAVRRGRLVCARVEHPVWPLRHARVIGFDEDLTRAAGLPAPDSSPVVHFSPGGVSRRLPV